MRALLITLLCLPLLGNAENYDWELVRDRNDVQVFTSPVEGSKFKAVRATLTIDTTLTELTALVQDASACPEWAAHCKRAEVVEMVAPETDMYVYTLNEMPWPVADRDAVAHVVWWQEADTKAVQMTATVVTDKLDKERGKVRLTYGETGWTFEPVTDGVRVTSFAHVDPGGAVPSWLSNRLLVDAPYDTLLGMRDLVATGRYADATFDFLEEPDRQ